MVVTQIFLVSSVGYLNSPNWNLLFLIYINDLHLAIKYFKVHHFEDDTNRLYINSSVKYINKQVNHDLRNLAHWLKENKISFNISKTEHVLFILPKKLVDSDSKITLNGKITD